MPPTRSRTERPYAPLLYAVTVSSVSMLSVSGRLRRAAFGQPRVDNETPPFGIGESNLDPLSGRGTLAAGQFYWGGILLKSNGGLRRLAQPGWQSGVEYMDRSQLNCETYMSSRYESRSK
jgi:hypothetical protein